MNSVAFAAVLLSATQPAVLAQQEDVLVLNGLELKTVELSNFVVTRSVSVSGGTRLQGIAYHSGRVAGVNDYWYGVPSNWTVMVHPADGASQLLGWSGPTPWINSGIDTDPATGLLWGINSRTAYTIDPFTGAAAIHGPVLNLGSWEVMAMAFEPGGAVIATPSSIPRVWRIDMTTFSATLLGTLALPWGNFIDLACSANGQLLGMFDSLVPGQAPSGIYEIDLVSMTAALRMPGHFDGIAFAPKVP